MSYFPVPFSHYHWPCVYNSICWQVWVNKNSDIPSFHLRLLPKLWGLGKIWTHHWPDVFLCTSITEFCSQQVRLKRACRCVKTIVCICFHLITPSHTLECLRVTLLYRSVVWSKTFRIHPVYCLTSLYITEPCITADNLPVSSTEQNTRKKVRLY